MLTSFLFGLLSALSFGVSNAYWKTAAKDVDYPYLVLFRGMIASIFFGCIWLLLLFYNVDTNNFINTSASFYDYLGTSILCLTCSLGLIFFLKSMKFVSVSISVAMSSVNITSILITVVIVGEEFNIVYAISFLVAIVGVLFTQKFDFKKIKFNWNRGASFALLASFFWGITYPLFKFASPVVGALPLSFILETSVLISSFIWINTISKHRFSCELFHIKLFKHYIILAILLICGTFSFNIAIQQLSVLSLDLISNLQFIVSVLLSIFLYQENLTIVQKIGVFLILLSIVLTQYFL